MHKMYVQYMAIYCMSHVNSVQASWLEETIDNLISILVLTNQLGSHPISVLGLTNLISHRLLLVLHNIFDSTLLGRALF